MDFVYHNFMREMAKYLIEEELDHTKALEDVRKRFAKAGISQEKFEQIVKKMGRPEKAFPVKAVINPKFIKDKFGVTPIYFVCDAREGKYPIVHEIMERYNGLASRYVVYGPEDSIIQLLSVPEDLDATLKELEDKGLEAYDLMVEESSIFKGLEVKDWKNPTIEFSPQQINKLVDEYFAEEYQDLRKKLEESNIILGGTVIEDYDETERIQALVGLNIHGRQTSSTHKNILDWFLEDEDIAAVLRSFYRCAIGSYNYLIEIICDKPSQLDYITDRFNDILKKKAARLKAETSTYVFAKVYETLPKYLGEGIADPLKFTNRGDSEQLLETKTFFIRPLSKDVHVAYAQLDEQTRANLLVFLYNANATANRLTKRKKKELLSSLRDFAGCSILGDKRGTLNSAKSLVTTVEKSVRESTSKIAKLFFQRRKNAIIRLSGAKSQSVDDWTLGECKQALESVNGLDLSKIFGVHFDGEFLQNLRDFIEIRNAVVHGRDLGVGKDITALNALIGNFFLKGFAIVSYLESSVSQREFRISPERYSDISTKKERTVQEKLFSQLEGVGTRVKNIEVAITALSPEIREQFNALDVKVRAIEFEAIKDRNVTRDLINYLVKNQEEILDSVKPREKTRVRKMIGFLGEGTREITWNTVANILAQILMNLKPESASDLLKSVGRLISG